MLNPCRFAEGACSNLQRLFAKVTFFVDCFHFVNHVDPWCKQHMDPKAVDGSEGINTQVWSWLCFHAKCACTFGICCSSPLLQVCEQLFHCLAKYKHAMRHMNRVRFIWVALRWCHLHNCAVERKMSIAGELVIPGIIAWSMRCLIEEWNAI